MKIFGVENISPLRTLFFFSQGLKGLGAFRAPFRAKGPFPHKKFLPWVAYSLWGSFQALPQPAGSAVCAHCCPLSGPDSHCLCMKGFDLDTLTFSFWAEVAL